MLGLVILLTAVGFSQPIPIAAGTYQGQTKIMNANGGVIATTTWKIVLTPAQGGLDLAATLRICA